MKKLLLIILVLLPGFLLAQGKVGVNVDPPEFQLDVRALSNNENTFFNLSNQDNSYFTRLLTGHSGFEASSISWTEGIPFNFGMWDGSIFTQLMQLSPLRRVGINIFDPKFTLDVRGTDDAEFGGEMQLSTPGETNYLRFFGGRLGDRNPFIAFHDLDTMHFVTTLPDWSTYTRRMTLLPKGDLGIGTQEIKSRLHLYADSGLGYPQLRLTEDGPDYARIKMENDADPGTYWDIAGRSDSVTENSRLNFFFYSPNGWGDRMTIRGNGKVGIGTIHPDSKLDIIGGDWNLEGGQPGDLRIGNSTYNLRIGVATGGDGAGISRIFAGGGANTLFFGTNNTRRMVITDEGNIGIGTDNPGNLLRVHGNPSSTQHVFSASSNYSGTVDVRAVEGFSNTTAGYGIGGYFNGGYQGVYGYNNAGPYGGSSYGVYGASFGTTGTRIGIYGTASGGNTNWAGYFWNGNVYMENELRIGAGASSGATGYKVAIDGKVIAEEIRIQNSTAWPDYVFNVDYDLKSLEEVADHIAEKKHLPGIPSAKEVEENGHHLGDMQVRMMEKIEELTLHLININKEMKGLKRKVRTLEEENALLKTVIQN